MYVHNISIQASVVTQQVELPPTQDHWFEYRLFRFQFSFLLMYLARESSKRKSKYLGPWHLYGFNLLSFRPCGYLGS